MLTAAAQRRLRAVEGGLVEHRFPPQIVIENTSYCNLRCVHCSHKEMHRSQRHMSRPLWDRLVTEIAREGPDSELWPTFYGEALIMGRGHEIWDRIDYAAEVGCRNLVLNSNGTLLDRWDNIQAILDSPLKRFILSLDGFSAPTMEAIRVGAKRDQVYAAVEELLARKVERRQTYPVIICQFSVMPRNRHEIAPFSDFWRQRGALVKVRAMLEWSASGSVRSETIDHATRFRIACGWGNNSMAIHQNGDVVTCPCDYEGRFKVGNAGEESLLGLWRKLGDALREPQREHRWADLPAICTGCRDWQAVGAVCDEAPVEGIDPFWRHLA